VKEIDGKIEIASGAHARITLRTGNGRHLTKFN
jgi:hypothetical protein